MQNVIQVVDANDETQNLCVVSPDTPVDKSGTFAATGVSQILLDVVAAGFQRGAWWIQNRSPSGTVVQINEIGGDADNASPTCVDLAPGQFWPPPGYPVTQAQVSIVGIGGEAFAAREWLTPVPTE